MVKKDRLAKVCGAGFRRAVWQQANKRAATIYIGLLVNYSTMHIFPWRIFMVYICLIVAGLRVGKGRE